MKTQIKYIITISLAVLALAQCRAIAQEINVGAKVGINSNQFTQPGMSIGYNAGAYASYQVLPFLNAKFEPQYSQIGGGLDQSSIYYGQGAQFSEVAQNNRNVKLQTFEFPLLAELSLPEFKDEKIIPKLILGGSYALMFKAMETHRLTFYSNSYYTIPTVDVGYQSKEVTDNYTRNQWSVIAGLGLQFKAAKRDYQIDFRYRQGVTQVSNFQYPSGVQSTPPYTSGPGGSLYTSSFSINFSMHIYKFQF
jgi:hypothetical protein